MLYTQPRASPKGVERFDRKTHMLDREEALGVRKEGQERRKRGKVDIREEYYVSCPWACVGVGEKSTSWMELVG